MKRDYLKGRAASSSERDGETEFCARRSSQDLTELSRKRPRLHAGERQGREEASPSLAFADTTSLLIRHRFYMQRDERTPGADLELIADEPSQNSSRIATRSLAGSSKRISSIGKSTKLCLVCHAAIITAMLRGSLHRKRLVSNHTQFKRRGGAALRASITVHSALNHNRHAAKSL